MKRGTILHRELNDLIGSAGHGDIIIVADAGLAIPRDIWRIELALMRDVPDLPTVLRLIHEELIIEKVCVTNEQKEYNAPMYEDIRAVFQGAPLDFELISHEKLLNEILPRATAVVRTGSFSPFGNTVLYPGIDAPKWFERKGLKVPAHYRSRVGGPGR